MFLTFLACSGSSTTPATPSDSGSSTIDTLSTPTGSSSSDTIPLTCEAPRGFPTAGCCGDGYACACDLEVLCDLGACVTADAFLAAHPADAHHCLQTGLGPAYDAAADGSPSYHLRCEDPGGGAEEVVERWYPTMEEEVWVFGPQGLASVDFSGESGSYCDASSPDVSFGAYQPPSGCCEVRDPAVTEGCRLPACP